MKSLTPLDNINNEIVKKLLQRISNKQGRMHSSSLYAGLSVANFLSKLETDEDDIVIIKVNKEVYNPILHDMKIIKHYKLKHEMIRKEFKERIIVHLNSIDDLVNISPDVKQYKSTYGYVIKVVLHITTG